MGVSVRVTPWDDLSKATEYVHNGRVVARYIDALVVPQPMPQWTRTQRIAFMKQRAAAMPAIVAPTLGGPPRSLDSHTKGTQTVADIGQAAGPTEPEIKQEPFESGPMEPIAMPAAPAAPPAQEPTPPLEGGEGGDRIVAIRDPNMMEVQDSGRHPVELPTSVVEPPEPPVVNQHNMLVMNRTDNTFVQMIMQQPTHQSANDQLALEVGANPAHFRFIMAGPSRDPLLAAAITPATSLAIKERKVKSLARVHKRPYERGVSQRQPPIDHGILAFGLSATPDMVSEPSGPTVESEPLQAAKEEGKGRFFEVGSTSHSAPKQKHEPPKPKTRKGPSGLERGRKLAELREHRKMVAESEPGQKRKLRHIHPFLNKPVEKRPKHE